MKSLSITYFPSSAGHNDYAEKNVAILSRLGVVSGTRDILRRIRLHPCQLPRRQDVAIINWIENLSISRSGVMTFRGLTICLCLFYFLKATSRKLVYVKHNNYPHHAKTFSKTLCKYLIRFFEWQADLVVIHSDAPYHRSEKSYYLPHPLYTLPSAQPCTGKPIDCIQNRNQKEFFLVFGSILPYKQIDKLLRLIGPTVPVVIAGNPSDQEYLKKLMLEAVDKNIHFETSGFLDDSSVQQLATRAIGMIICNAGNDMIVSGSFFYSLSLGIPVYALETPFLQWVRDELKIPGIQLFKTHDELCIGLDSLPEETSFCPNMILATSEKHFSDQQVLKNWNYILHEAKSA